MPDHDTKYVYLVVRKVPYEGSSVQQIFSNRSDADKHADKLQSCNDMKGHWDYVVEEWELYVGYGGA